MAFTRRTCRTPSFGVKAGEEREDKGNRADMARERNAASLFGHRRPGSAPLHSLPLEENSGEKSRGTLAPPGNACCCSFRSLFALRIFKMEAPHPRLDFCVWHSHLPRRIARDQNLSKFEIRQRRGHNGRVQGEEAGSCRAREGREAIEEHKAGYSSGASLVFSFTHQQTFGRLLLMTCAHVQSPSSVNFLCSCSAPLLLCATTASGKHTECITSEHSS